jgi:hypothetical protein
MTFAVVWWYSVLCADKGASAEQDTDALTCCFAIIPDGFDVPVAVFESLEDAMEWGVHKYGGGRFTIRHMPVTQAVATRAKKAAAS